MMDLKVFALLLLWYNGWSVSLPAPLPLRQGLTPPPPFSSSLPLSDHQPPVQNASLHSLAHTKKTDNRRRNITTAGGSIGNSKPKRLETFGRGIKLAPSGERATGEEEDVMQKRNGDSPVSHMQGGNSGGGGSSSSGSDVQGNVVPGAVDSVVREQGGGGGGAWPESSSLGDDGLSEGGGEVNQGSPPEGRGQHASVDSVPEGREHQHIAGPVFRESEVGHDGRRSTRPGISLSPTPSSVLSENVLTSAPVVHLPPVLNQVETTPRTMTTQPSSPLRQEVLGTTQGQDDSSSISNAHASVSQQRTASMNSTASTLANLQPERHGRTDGSVTSTPEIKAGEIQPGGGFGLPLMPYGHEEELSSTGSTSTTTTTTTTTVPSQTSSSSYLTSLRRTSTAPVHVTRSLVSPHTTTTQSVVSSPHSGQTTSLSGPHSSTLMSVLTQQHSETEGSRMELATEELSHSQPGQLFTGTAMPRTTQSSSSSSHGALSTVDLVNPAQPGSGAEVEHPVLPVNSASPSSSPFPSSSSSFLPSSSSSPPSSSSVLSLLSTGSTLGIVSSIRTSSSLSVSTAVPSTPSQGDSTSQEQGTRSMPLVSTKQDQPIARVSRSVTASNHEAVSHASETASPFTSFTLLLSSGHSTIKTLTTTPSSEQTTSSPQSFSASEEILPGRHTTIKSNSTKQAEDVTEAVTHMHGGETGRSSSFNPSTVTTTAYTRSPEFLTSTRRLTLSSNAPSVSTQLATSLSSASETTPQLTHPTTQPQSSENQVDVESYSSTTNSFTTSPSTFSSTNTTYSQSVTVVSNTPNTVDTPNDDSKKDADNRSESNNSSSPSPQTSTLQHSRTTPAPATAVIHNQIHTPHNDSRRGNSSSNASSNKSGNTPSRNQEGNSDTVTNTTATTVDENSQSSSLHSNDLSSSSPTMFVQSSTESSATTEHHVQTSSQGHSEVSSSSSSSHGGVVPVLTPDLLGPVYIGVKLKMTWTEFCSNERTFCLELVDIVREDGQIESFTADQIRILENPHKTCALRTSGGEEEEFSTEEEEIEVQLYLVNKSHHYDVNLTYVCARLIKQGFELRETSMFKNRLIKVQLHEMSGYRPHGGSGGTHGGGSVGSSVNDDDDDDGDDDDDDFIDEPGVTIVISIAAVGGVCCGALIIMQLVLRRRYRDGMRAFTNRSSSATSVDSIALNHVIKARPQSGHSNPGLDLTPERLRGDSSHPLNFTELSNFAMNLEGIYREFQLIPNKTPRLSVVPVGAEDKNRFANILPIPDTRVRLDGREGDEVAAFINANYISGYRGQADTYIATQAPLEGTVGDLWTMVWQQHCPAIVMLINPVEDGHKKCATYFPDSAGPESALKCGEFSVTMTKRDVHQEYITSWLQVKKNTTGECRCVRHFWLTCWPMLGRPEPVSLLRFVLDTRPLYEDSGASLIVHCSNGTGRTGTFLALDLCMRQYEDRRTVDVMRCVASLRHERAGCLQTSEQYALLYQALSEYAAILSSPAVSAASSATTLHAMLP